jgi:hypothetical protein
VVTAWRRGRQRCSDEEGAAGLASSEPVAHGEHSEQGEEAADSPWRRGDSEVVEWVGAVAALQRRWGATAITDDLGWLRHHPWNRRKVSISSSERILQSVGRSSDEGGNDDTGPKFRWRAEAPAVEERTKGDVGWRGRCWSAWEWMRGRGAEDRHTGARGSSSMDEAAPREKKREGSVHDTRGMKERGTWWRGCDAWRRGGVRVADRGTVPVEVGGGSAVLSRVVGGIHYGGAVVLCWPDEQDPL